MSVLPPRRFRLALPLPAALLISLALSCAAEVDVEKLFLQSHSSDYEERLEARHKLEGLVTGGKVEPFARGLRSENSETRVQSLLHLMLIKKEEARKVLVGELELSRRFNVFYNPIRLVPVSTPYDSRIMVARIVFLQGGDPEAVDVLGASYGKEPDAEARVGTVYALGALVDPRTVPALKKALRDRDLNVVRAAMEGLSQLQVPDVADSLLQGLTDSDEAVRVNCASALSGFPGRTTADALMEAVRKDPSEKVRLAALSSVAYSGGADSFEFILGVLKSPEAGAEMRSQAASALQAITNQDFGQDAARWARWYQQNRKNLPGP